MWVCKDVQCGVCKDVHSVCEEGGEGRARLTSSLEAGPPLPGKSPPWSLTFDRGHGLHPGGPLQGFSTIPGHPQ